MTKNKTIIITALLIIGIFLVSTISAGEVINAKEENMIQKTQFSFWDRFGTFLFALTSPSCTLESSWYRYYVGGTVSLTPIQNYELRYKLKEGAITIDGTSPSLSKCESDPSSYYHTAYSGTLKYGDSTKSWTLPSTACWKLEYDKYFCPQCNADSCDGKTFYKCVNYGWVSQGKVIGKCGVECTTDSNCGTDGYIGSKYCNGNVYQKYREYDCSSYECGYYDTEKLIESCVYGCLNGICQGEPVVCNTGDEKCVGTIYHKCISNAWESQGEVTGKCGMTCTENDIILISDVYNICRNGTYRPVLDVIELSPDEQARLLNIINQLETTVEQKIEIINNLTTTVEGQIILISQLEATTQEKAQIIKALELNIQEQATLINQMQLTVAEQYSIINELDLTIQEQADLINQMQVNLAAKAALIQLLQVENEKQAQLIADMKLSFSEQADIINALNNLIGDDAEIILNLYATTDQQAQLINELNFTKEELSKLISAMGLTIKEDADLINQLKLTTEEQLSIIAELNLSLDQEKELVAQLKLTIEDQNKLIEDLKNQPAAPTEFDWNKVLFEAGGFEVTTLYLLIGGVILLLLLMAGKWK